MAKTIWMAELSVFSLDGDHACFVMETDGKPVAVRCKRHVALAAIKYADRRYCEIERAERKASVVPIRKR